MATNTSSKKKPATARKPASAAKPEEPKAPAAVQEEPDGTEAVKEALSSGDLVRFYVPRDPSNGDSNFFERSINGHILRLKAGTVMELPLWLVEFVESRLEIQRLSNEEYARFTSDSGAKIG